MNQAEKVGLALSGGGFRAAFFHIGVLARLAELGLLRHVEIISTVSGGSIVGALYYLHVKQLLEQNGDGAVHDADYVAIIQRIETDFLKAVQQNIRMRTFLNPLKNLRMALRNYSRSDRIGELYDAHFYRPVFAPGRAEPVQMQELKIQPLGAPANFSPRKHNAARRAKVPILLINATTLNTGHNWRFEAVQMGEPIYEDNVAKEVDKNLRLRRPGYEQIRHTRHDRFELGLAVAASACVPGLFPPLAISDLYPDLRVQLVDGGVHDNQGVQGLRDEGCTHLIISDASGWLQDQAHPATSLIPTWVRSNDILMDRVREEELYRLYEADPMPSRLAFLHLRKGLEAEALSWIAPTGKAPFEPPKRERAPSFSCKDFGVCGAVQDRLSRIRTDLDSFTEVEAHSLMMDGYSMTGFELNRTRDFAAMTVAHPPASWTFLQIRDWMLNPSSEYLRQLDVARHNLFKVFRLSPAVTIASALAALAALYGLWAGLGSVILQFLRTPVTVGGILVVVGLYVIGIVAPQLEILQFLRGPGEWVTRVVLRALVPAVGSLFVALYLLVFDRMFMYLGTVDRLRRGGQRMRRDSS